MEDIMSSTGAIDAMSEEIIKPAQQYESAKSQAPTVGSVTGIPDRAKVTERGSDIMTGPSETSSTTSEMTGTSGEIGGTGVIGGIANDKHGRKNPLSPSQQRKNAGGNTTGSGSETKTRVGPPPKLPPKPPGLLEKVKEFGKGPPVKQKPAVLPKGKGTKDQSTSSSQEPLSQDRLGMTTLNSTNSSNSVKDTGVSGDASYVGKPSGRNSPKPSTGMKPPPPLPALRSPVAVTRSLAGQVNQTKQLHDGIQRTCSSPPASSNKTANVTSSIDSETKHSTEHPQQPPKVMSRVHNIQDHLTHPHTEAPVITKKLSVLDHHIKVRERAAVFEKIVQGISEETSIVSLDIDAAGGRKRSARKPDGPGSPTLSAASGSGNLVEKEGVDTTHKSLLIKTESLPVTGPSLPIPRPRSNRTLITDSNKGSIHSKANRPVPQPRISLVPKDNTDPNVAAEASNTDSANPDDIYDEVCEFARSDIIASLANRESEVSTCTVRSSGQNEATENIYEDTLLPDTYMESIPRLPPDPPSPSPTPLQNTCQRQLSPLLPERGPPMRSAAAKEMVVTDESASRERGSIYEVCLSEDDQSDDRTALVADTTTTEDQATHQEMPAQTPGDQIIPSKDEEAETSLGTQKISRQRRIKKSASLSFKMRKLSICKYVASLQQRVAVKMRSAEGSGLMQRRNGDLKRQGRSLQDVNQVRDAEKVQKAEENGVNDVTQPVAPEELYMSLCDDQGSDGNEYEEVPTMMSSEEEPEKEETAVVMEMSSTVEQLKVDKEEVTEAQEETKADYLYMELEEERRDSIDDISDGNIRDRAKTSPESVRAAGRQKMKKKRYSEGAFEDFVPLFFKKDAPEDGESTKDQVPRSKSQGSISDTTRPLSVSTAVMEDIRLIRAELDRRNARRLDDEKEEEEKAAQLESLDPADGEDTDSYQYVTEVNFGNENMSSDESSDYEQVTDDMKHVQTSGASYDLEEHRRTLSRDGSHVSGGSATSDYLMLFEDWKAVEENGLIARRNKGSNEKKERRKVFATDSSSSDANMTQSTTQGSLDIQDLSDSQMNDENGVYRSFDAPGSPETHPNGHKMLKQGGISLPGLEVTPPKITHPVEAPPPPPLMKKPLEKASLPVSSSGFSRKPSRFVGKEPLFQIYQADLRVRDSKVILRPRAARRSKKPPLPARPYLANRNQPPPLPPHHPQGNKPSLPAAPPPPLPARNNSNLSTVSNISNITNKSLASTNSSNISQNAFSTEIRSSLQKELFTKLNTSSEMSKIENFTPINNNIRSGDSHKIMDNSRAFSGNSVSENANNVAETSQLDEMEDPTYMSGNDEESSSTMYSCEDESLSEMDRNRTHGSSMETRSSQQSGEGASDEDPIYQGGLGDPIYQPGMEDGIYQSGMEHPTYGGGEGEDDDGYDEFDDDFDDDDYYTPPPRDGPVREGSVVLRSYWCELPEVVSSGLLQNLTQEEKKMQEALFEIITSEASYLKSLNLVVNHFCEAPGLLPSNGVLKRPEHHSLFSNIKTVRDISERLLLDLEQHQQESILLSDVCRILLSHLKDQRFEQGFVTYCANNQYQVRMLDQFRNNVAVMNEIRELEASPECCCLDLLSFLMLPFQRITRLPLLLEAVISRAPEGSDMMSHAVDAFTAVRTMAEKCNEEAKRMEMIEEVTILARMLDFKKDVKKMDISQSSTIVKRGMLDSIIYQANILGGKKKPTTKRIYCIVFTDKVLLAKEKVKGEQKRFDVIDWCPRNLVQLTVVDQPNMCSKLIDGVPPDCHCIFTLNLLQNNQRKTNEFILNAKSLSERQRWMDAFCPPTETEDGERIYESWDCPQVICMTNYEAKDRDELTLEQSDRVDVYKKIDGWYEGQLVGRRERGWFPASCVQEVVNDHVRARILKKRHKILSMCEEQIRLAMAGPKVK
ncbi:uncharacterized protein LOC129275930 isoform X2 [Lytechinus pictus]|uniref:uncharacterized protein LOC129275930 isoform X2 n=1 Tax=Lytechinus pictus TaxID=7653 RepID=UPI0030BA050E